MTSNQPTSRGQTVLIDSNNSKKLSVMNFAMTIAIVVFHWKNFYMLNLTAPVNQTIGVTAYGILNVLSPVSLRFFFFISAFLLYFGISDTEDVKRKLKKRLYSLGIPFLVWNVLILVWNFAYTFLTRRALPNYRPLDYLLGFSFEPFCGPFWYILALLMLLPLTLLTVCIKHRRALTTAMLAALAIAALILSPVLKNVGGFFGNWFSNLFDYVPAYCLGVWFALYCPRAVLFESASVFALVIAIGALAVSAVTLTLDFPYDAALDKVAYLAIPTALWILLPPSCFRKIKITYPLKISFFIYAMHAALIGLLNTVLARVVGLNSLNLPATVAVHVGLLAILYAICLGFAFACKKILPKKFYAVLSGGRA